MLEGTDGSFKLCKLEVFLFILFNLDFRLPGNKDGLPPRPSRVCLACGTRTRAESVFVIENLNLVW